MVFVCVKEELWKEVECLYLMREKVDIVKG